MKGYGQFCPVAKASEILAERWTPLVLRELLAGSRRFNDVQRGVPLMSRSLLAKRLRELERAGVVERRAAGGGRRTHEYFLTPAGEELRPIVEALGVWGQRWVMADLDDEDLDPSLLMWDVRRNLVEDELPEERAVVRFDFVDVQGPYRRWWLLAEKQGGDVCLTDPGFEVDLVVSVPLRALTRFWIGQLDWRALAAEDGFALDGARWLQRALPGWLQRSGFADVEKPPAAAR